MNDYFTGSINQLVERARLLRAKIPRNLPRDYDTLAQKCAERLQVIIDELRDLIDNPVFQLPEVQGERLRRYRRLVADMDMIEAFAIAALDRTTAEDHRLNDLTERIAREIRYPLVTPVVTTLSQQYFWIQPELKLLSVPLTEGRFLLHLPDLYHELAHPLLIERDDPIVEPFQACFAQAIEHVLSYIAAELVKEDRSRGPEIWPFLLRLWESTWVKYWLAEFFCDLFAVYTLGPAFAWAHLHLAAKRGGNPFHVPAATQLSHPADDARMRTMLHALTRAGFTDQATVIQEQWRHLLAQGGERPEPEYHRCYPEEIMQRMALLAYSGVTAIGCRIAAPDTQDEVHTMLNEAWHQFWHDPAGYVRWEQQAAVRGERKRWGAGPVRR